MQRVAPVVRASGQARYAHASLAKGSQSFAAAARVLPRGVRDDVAKLYAWCRHADDLIDGQVYGHGHAAVSDPAARLAELRHATDEALAGRATGAPTFDGFGEVARAHGISHALAHDLLDGFSMDVAGRTYRTEEELATYCYGVAGAVGVMMALVLGVRADEKDTLDRASDLGLAFQMTNIARDVVADAKAGRLYLPTDRLAEEGVAPTPAAVADPANAEPAFRVAQRLVRSADRYYASAHIGIARLPYRAAWAIASAAAIYRAIGTRRSAAGPAGLARRVHTPPARKLALVATSALTPLRGSPDRDALERTGLWTRPLRP